MRHYSAIKRSGVLTHATTCGNLEIIILRERSQTPNIAFEWSHLYEVFRIGKAMETERKPGIASGWKEDKVGWGGCDC